MKNPVLEEIRDFATSKLTEAYGYCGSADSPDLAMLNSDDKNGGDIKIIIKSEKEEEGDDVT